MPTPIMPSKPVVTEAEIIVAVQAELVGGAATVVVVLTTAVALTAVAITGTAEAGGGGTIIPSVRSSPTDCSRWEDISVEFADRPDRMGQAMVPSQLSRS